MKKLPFLIIGLAIFILVIGALVYFLVFQKPAGELPLVPEEKTAEEILQSLAAPPAEGDSQASQEIMNSLTVPGEGEEAAPEDILKSLTAPK